MSLKIITQKKWNLAGHILTAKSDSKKAEFRYAAKSDVPLRSLQKKDGLQISAIVRPFWKVRDELHVTEGLIFTGE